MTKRSITIVCALLAGSVMQTAQAELKTVIEARELMIEDVLLTKQLKGIITGRECQKCPLLSYTLTPKTRFKVQGVEKPLHLLRSLQGRGGAVAVSVDDPEVALTVASFD